MRRARAGILWAVVAATGCATPDSAGDSAPVGGTDSADCPAGSVRDGQACVPEACGVGPWGDVPRDETTVFVDAAGGTDGDGSEAAPLTTVQAGVDLAAAHGGGAVLLAAGTYLENVAMGDDHRGVTLTGRCPDLVTVDGSAGPDLAVVHVTGKRRSPEVTLRGFQAQGGAAGVWAQHAQVVLMDVSTIGNRDIGLVVTDGARVTAEHVEVSDPDPEATSTYGWGAFVTQADLTWTDGAVVRARVVGVLVSGNGTAALDRVAIADTLGSIDGAGGRGIEANSGGAVTAHASTILGTRGFGAYVDHARLDLDASTVAGTRAGSDGGFGVAAFSGAEVTLTDAVVEEGESHGVYAWSDARVTLSDSTVRANGTDGTSSGVAVFGGARVEGAGVHLDENFMSGLAADGAGSTVVLTGSTVRGTRRGRVTAAAVGLLVQDEAEVTADGLTVSETDGPGLYVPSGLDSALSCTGCTVDANGFAGVLAVQGSLRLEDSAVTATAPDPELGGGFGVFAWGLDDLSVTVRDSTVGPHPYAAVWITGPGRYELSGNTLSGSDGVEVEGWTLHGNALFAEAGTKAWDGATGLRLVDNLLVADGGVALLLDGGTATLEGNTFTGAETDIWQQRCASSLPLGETDLLGAATTEICPSANLLTAYDLEFPGIYLPDVTTEG